ncbi:hypothetical protein PUN28_008243 [Cardiocondyla obscurior]|uniref:Uncharacterized protein n=1 Tax=Cardiocondyla obscurior TaxID=286306 RepID=A0AAW2FZV4_9HYME
MESYRFIIEKVILGSVGSTYIDGLECSYSRANTLDLSLKKNEIFLCRNTLVMTQITCIGIFSRYKSFTAFKKNQSWFKLRKQSLIIPSQSIKWIFG